MEFCILIADFLEKAGDDYLKSHGRRGQVGFPIDVLIEPGQRSRLDKLPDGGGILKVERPVGSWKRLN
jgi:hypothetical protein